MYQTSYLKFRRVVEILTNQNHSLRVEIFDGFCATFERFFIPEFAVDVWRKSPIAHAYTNSVPPEKDIIKHIYLKFTDLENNFIINNYMYLYGYSDWIFRKIN